MPKLTVTNIHTGPVVLAHTGLVGTESAGNSIDASASATFTVSWIMFNAVKAYLDDLVTATKITYLAVENKPYHINDTATTSNASVNVYNTATSNPASMVSVQNSGATNNLLVSFDGGTKYCTLFPKASVCMPGVFLTIDVKSNASTTTYEVIATNEPLA